MEMRQEKFGAVIIGKGFDCVKRNGKAYAGHIVKVAAYPKGTLVTVEWYDPADRPEGMYSLGEQHASYRSVYLEDCAEWSTYVYGE